MTSYDAYRPAVDAPSPTDLAGRRLLTNQLLTEGHRATVDWGKRDYDAGTPGQIVGITYFATTRNEFDARSRRTRTTSRRSRTSPSASRASARRPPNTTTTSS